MGPRGAPVWEQYRKDWDDSAVRFPVTVALDAGPDGLVLYDQVRQGFTDGGVNSFIGPGMFISTRSARCAVLPRTSLAFGRTTSSAFDACAWASSRTAPRAERHALDAFVSNLGADNGRLMDMYYGGWGVDGIVLEMTVLDTAATWTLCPLHANLVAAASGEWQDATAGDAEPERTHLSQVAVDALPAGMGFSGGVNCGSAGAFDLGLTTAQPLIVSWRLFVDAGVVLEANLGPTATVSWKLDDGAARRGLTQPGNADGIGYQGGAIDTSALVPAMFVAGGRTSTPMLVPSTQMVIGVAGATPVIEGLPSSAVPGTAVSVHRHRA